MIPEEQKADALADRSLNETLFISAPRELVFTMWTEPEYIAKWWGPMGFTITIKEMDVRPDGFWRFMMHGPDGRDYRNEIQYRKVIRPELITFDHGPSPIYHMTARFTDTGPSTRLDVSTIFYSKAERDNVIRVFRADSGLKETLKRLAEMAEDFGVQRGNGDLYDTGPK